jgi:solute carrier family 25 citrate transporter 1
VTGCFEISITYPLEFVKNSLQLEPGKFSGPADCVRRNVAASGLSVLYKGFPTWILFAFPRNAVRFCTFEAAAGWIGPAEPGTQLVRDAACGLVAGVAEALVTLTPMQNFSIKLTHDANRPLAQRRFAKFFPALRTIAREEGFRGLYVPGAAACAAKAGLNYAIRFPVYHGLKRRIEAQRAGQSGKGVGRLQPHETLACGAASGFVSACVSHPLDVVKANMMGLNASRFGGCSRACLRSILARDGVRGLYQGLLPRLARVCLEMALLFGVYEMVADALVERLRERRTRRGAEREIARSARSPRASEDP